MVDDSKVALLVERAAREHAALLERSRPVRPDQVPAILALGTAVVLHGLLEESCVHALNPYLDPELVDELNAEHDRLASDLRLLEEIWRTRPHSGDVRSLAGALLDTLRDHLERDQRTLYHTLERLHLVPGTTGSEPERPSAADDGPCGEPPSI